LEPLDFWFQLHSLALAATRQPALVAAKTGFAEMSTRSDVADIVIY
jgi:hypothetical protein